MHAQQSRWAGSAPTHEAAGTGLPHASSIPWAQAEHKQVQQHALALSPSLMHEPIGVDQPLGVQVELTEPALLPP